MARLVILVMFGVLIVACDPRPCVCNCAGAEVRAHVIDSLKAIYEELNQPKQVTTAQSARPAAAAPEPRPEEADTPIGDTYTAKDGTVYAVHTGKNGGRYIEMVSKKTGKTYKRYLK
jgi:hypothetical protein